jgi:hypothetical protein
MLVSGSWVAGVPCGSHYVAPAVLPPLANVSPVASRLEPYCALSGLFVVDCQPIRPCCITSVIPFLVLLLLFLFFPFPFPFHLLSNEFPGRCPPLVNPYGINQPYPSPMSFLPRQSTTTRKIQNHPRHPALHVSLKSRTVRLAWNNCCTAAPLYLEFGLGRVARTATLWLLG